MAAGQGYIEFATGDVLTAAAANGYLASQVVMVFADAAARTAAIASPQEGMISYLKDTNSTEYYSGSAWVAIGGGGLSSPLTTKGDVWGYSTTNARIPVGTNGQVLTADSAEALGVKWASPAGGGKVLQVVSATSTTSTTVATGNYTDTTLTANITPSSNTSKILVIVNQRYYASRDTRNHDMDLILLRSGTQILYQAYSMDTNGSTTSVRGSNTSMQYLDSPATTSALTYKTQGRMSTTANSAQVIFQHGSNVSSILLLEIGA